MTQMMKNLIQTDLKIFEDFEDERKKSQINRVMAKYDENKGDYENSVITESIFIRLGWSNRYKDTIGTFIQFYSLVAVCMTNKNQWTYDGVICNCSEPLYKLNNNNNLTYCWWCKDSNRGYKRTPFPKKKIGEKFFIEKNVHSEKTMEIVENFDELKEIAVLTDSISNFTPHPGYPFNQLKGVLPDVSDFFNLMIDKIQSSIDDKKDLECQNYTVKLKDLIKWRDWFIEYRKVYCLEEFYTVENNRIIGTPLFKGQSLEECNTTDEMKLKECLNTFVERLKNRATAMSKQLR